MEELNKLISDGARKYSEQIARLIDDNIKLYCSCHNIDIEEEILAAKINCGQFRKLSPSWNKTIYQRKVNNEWINIFTVSLNQDSLGATCERHWILEDLERYKELDSNFN